MGNPWSASAWSNSEGVRKRGLLRCGVSQGLAGFSRQDNLGTWEGLDVDYCRAIALLSLVTPRSNTFH